MKNSCVQAFKDFIKNTMKYNEIEVYSKRFDNPELARCFWINQIITVQWWHKWKMYFKFTGWQKNINLCSKRLRFHQFSLHPTMQHLGGTWKDQHVKGQGKNWFTRCYQWRHGAPAAFSQTSQNNGDIFVGTWEKRTYPSLFILLSSLIPVEKIKASIASLQYSLSISIRYSYFEPTAKKNTLWEMI